MQLTETTIQELRDMLHTASRAAYIEGGNDFPDLLELDKFCGERRTSLFIPKRL